MKAGPFVAGVLPRQRGFPDSPQGLRGARVLLGQLWGGEEGVQGGSLQDKQVKSTKNIGRPFLHSNLDLL